MAAPIIERVERICSSSRDERELRAALLAELRSALDFDWYAWLLTDPVTEVGSAPLAEIPSLAALPSTIRSKYLSPVNRWTGLGAHAVSLRGAAERRPGADGWIEVLRRFDIDDVASVVFRDAHGCWAWVDLWRNGGREPFTDHELSVLSSTVEPVTRALRQAQARTFASGGRAPVRSGPAVLVLAPDLQVKVQTAETVAYLRALVPPDGDGRPVPAAAYNVAAQLLAIEAGVDTHPAWARVHLGDGVWLTLRAVRVEADAPLEQRDIAVSIEPSSTGERRELFARAHGLTPRESELLEHLVAGADTASAAKLLHVSGYTVQDHLKSVFAKTGVRNRRTLVTRISGS